MSKTLKIIKKPRSIIKILGNKGLFNWLPDRLYLPLVYWAETNKRLNLKQPKAFTEKLQWLKLYYRKSDDRTYVDKYKVRSYIKSKIGSEYLIPIIGVYDTVNEIAWDSLPEKFILKCSHGSGSNIICIDKSSFNIGNAKNKLKFWMKKNWYWFGREWVYKDIKPRIICEEFLSDNGLNKAGLVDFKFYCFNGVPQYCQVIQGRGGNETIDFYDMNWKHMPFNGLRQLPQSITSLEKPLKFDKMVRLSQKLSQELPFVRVDWYYVQNKIYFGELTFFPTSGFGQFNPPEWDEKIGDLLQLPNKIGLRQ